MAFPYTYSFESVNATITGPNGTFSIGQGAGVDEGGITVEMSEPKNTRTTGADGLWMHSLHAGKSGKVTVRLLKNSVTNALLNAMYNADTSNPAAHGQNVITISNVLSGDVISAQGAAFSQQPTMTYAKEGGMVEWAFDVGRVEETLGAGATA
jgi:hypothetical protein